MDIFKLFYNHDQRLDELHRRKANKTAEEVKATLADFVSPDPTYSKFYLTGTRFPNEQFGINKLDKYKRVLDQLDQVFNDEEVYTAKKNFDSLSESIEQTAIGNAIIISDRKNEATNISGLKVDSQSNVDHSKSALADVLKANQKVLYKEQARNGFDLHLFSKENIYPQLFEPLQTLADDSFRFFSINSKRMRSERHFYFETWTLERPPHGAEEVFRDTVLRSKK